MEDLFELVDREVWIVTAAHGGRRGGLLATWVSSVSLDPDRPVALAGLGPTHYTTELVDRSHRFGLHLLRENQASVGLQFALGSGRDRDKFAPLSWRHSSQGIPLLDDCLAWMTCEVFARLNTGNRVFFWGRALESESGDGTPLRQSHVLSVAGPDERERLKADRQQDATLPWTAGEWTTW